MKEHINLYKSAIYIASILLWTVAINNSGVRTKSPYHPHGAAWRDLPERYGPWQTVYKRFVKWSEAGIFEKIFKDLAADADMQDISIDSTCIKAHKSSAGAKKEKS